MIHMYGMELLPPRPTPKLENHPLSAVRNCLFNIFAATLRIGGRSSISNLRTHHAVVRGTHLITERFYYIVNILRCPGIKRILLSRYVGCIPG